MSDLPPNIPQCQHVHFKGTRCGSPALRGKTHCYYHDYVSRPHEELAGFEDAESIQLSLRQVASWVNGGMETKRAALILYALQIASSNLSRIKYVYPGDMDINFSGEPASPGPALAPPPRLAPKKQGAEPGAPKIPCRPERKPADEGVRATQETKNEKSETAQRPAASGQ